MVLFGPLHIGLILTTAIIAFALCVLSRREPASRSFIRYGLGIVLLLNEIGWCYFRYSHEGLRADNLPLQLCDISLMATVVACLFLRPILVEFAYFAGIAGAGMALITPDLWSPWPSYPAICFFVSHGGIVIANVVLVYGRIAILRPGAMWRAFGIFVGLALITGVFNAIFKTNFMYLCAKPQSASLLDALGPWPIYVLVGLGISLVFYALLWLPARNLERPSAG